jgi:hypothetical protein
MVWQYDNSNGNGGYPPGGVSFSLSIGQDAGNNRCVLVGFHVVGGTGHSVTSATLNSVALTYLYDITENYFGRDVTTFVYYMMDDDLPSSSGSYTVSVEVDGTSDPYDMVVNASSYYNVSQSTPPYAASSDFSNPAFDTVEYDTDITVAASAGVLVDFGGAEDSGATAQAPTSGQTERQDRNYNSSLLAVSDKGFTSSGSNNMGQTPSGQYWSFCHIVVELAEADPDGIILLGSDSWLANINSVSYNGQALTKINEYDGGTHNSVSWWYLDDEDFPSTPGSYTLAVTFSASMAPGFMMVMEVKNAKQGDEDAENSSYQANTDTLNTTITTLEDNSWVCGFVTTGQTGSFTPDSGQTELEEQSGGTGGASAVMGYEKIDSAGATGMQWVADSTRNRFLQMVIAIAPYIEAEGSNAVLLASNF